MRVHPEVNCTAGEGTAGDIDPPGYRFARGKKTHCASVSPFAAACVAVGMVSACVSQTGQQGDSRTA
jgi:hypothetical protein